jgi:hypothetical protein
MANESEFSKSMALILNDQRKKFTKIWQKPGVSHIFFGFALAAQIWTAFIFIRYAIGYISLPYAADFGEGAILDQTLRLARFENIYTRNFPPYSISNYPPLFPLVQVPFAWMFGPGYWYGQLLSLGSTIAAAVFLGMTVRHLTRDKFAGLTGALIFLAVPYVVLWAPLNRIDCLALASTWAGLFVICRWPDRLWSVLATSLLFAASIYTRQSYLLSGPASAFVWLMSYRGTEEKPLDLRYRAVLLLALTVGVTAGALFLLQYWTDGGFLFHVVKATMNEFLWERVTMFLRGAINSIPFFLLTGAVFLLIGPIFRIQSWWLVAPYFLCALISALTVGKVGSDVNYMFELSSAACLATAVALGSLKKNYLRVVFLVLLTAQIFQIGYYSHFRFRNRIEALSDQLAERHRALKMVKESDGIVLADELMSLIPLSGRTLYYQPFIMTELAREGKWNETPFVKEIREKKFALILMTRSAAYWTPAMMEAITSSYRKVDRFTIFKRSPTRVYRP